MFNPVVGYSHVLCFFGSVKIMLWSLSRKRNHHNPQQLFYISLS
ncbi:hypothetical protein JCM19294_2046 [Nonlabens tegetincola]|uniref:Uncharacterized protein n=1 Tax=Nonlabens tegetincola TaxID=323273 RepID=A0A090Q479_9FLAO|nr:hypothetical protein JCM19294_2046 [Nonlabens tegetincola]